MLHEDLLTLLSSIFAFVRLLVTRLFYHTNTLLVYKLRLLATVKRFFGRTFFQDVIRDNFLLLLIVLRGFTLGTFFHEFERDLLP